jgi:hypothetical protein
MAPDQITAGRAAASALSSSAGPPVGLRLLLDDAETAADAITAALDPSRPPGMRKQSSSGTTTDTAGSLALRERMRQVRTERGQQRPIDCGARCGQHGAERRARRPSAANQDVTAAVGRVAGRAGTRPLPVRPLQTSEEQYFLRPETTWSI